jgi:L-ascorbate metabolism protein UlaG (beta-lactamase superfamily)
VNAAITLLNHAAVKIQIGGVSVLTDPWFWGTCFKDGWGLCTDSPAALEEARSCDVMWISHFHGDHLHVPTLKELARLAPAMLVVANDSVNFSMSEAMRRIGFRNVVSLAERSAFQVDGALEVLRIPATGIDNMLVMRGPDGILLNYNDCNLPYRAIKALAARIGAIDILLTNYNVAGKVLELPAPEPGCVKLRQREMLERTVDLFDPRWVVPFASMHYFRAPESQDHNDMLLTAAELAAADPRIIPVEVGDRVVFDRASFRLEREALPVSAAVRSRVVRGTSRSPQDLQRVGAGFVEELGRRFLRLTWLIPPLRIHVADWQKDIVLHLRKGVLFDTSGDEPVIEAHSQALFDWWSEPYGTDGFVVGAHFRLLRSNLRALRLLLLAALLKENNLSLRDTIRMLVRPAGWRFFYNRREEIAAVIVDRKIRTGVRQ